MQIEIKQHHIDAGRQKDSRGCAIARAFYEMGAKDVYVGGGAARVDGHEFMLDPNGYDFVRKFDSDKQLVQPTVLNLIPSPYFPSSHNFQQQYAYAHAPKPYIAHDEYATVGETPKATQYSYKMEFKPYKFSGADYAI